MNYLPSLIIMYQLIDYNSFKVIEITYIYLHINKILFLITSFKAY